MKDVSPRLPNTPAAPENEMGYINVGITRDSVAPELTVRIASGVRIDQCRMEVEGVSPGIAVA